MLNCYSIPVNVFKRDPDFLTSLKRESTFLSGSSIELKRDPDFQINLKRRSVFIWLFQRMP